jgi:hypothetical protein
MRRRETAKQAVLPHRPKRPFYWPAQGRGAPTGNTEMVALPGSATKRLGSVPGSVRASKSRAPGGANHSAAQAPSRAGHPSA